jgi:hypothetical protein
MALGLAAAAIALQFPSAPRKKEDRLTPVLQG